MSFSISICPVTHFQQNCSILFCRDSGKAALVDPGGEQATLIKLIEDAGMQLEKIFLTHGHLAHVGAAKAIAEQYQVPIEGPHIADKYWLDDIPQYAEMMQFPATETFTPDRWLEQGDEVCFGQQRLAVHHCPGHTPGHIVFFHAEKKVAMVGDVLFKGSIGRTDFPGGNHQQLIDSIQQKLFNLGDEVQFIPGHGPVSTIGEERQSNPFVADQRYG